LRACGGGGGENIVWKKSITVLTALQNTAAREAVSGRGPVSCVTKEGAADEEEPLPLPALVEGSALRIAPVEST
jgi:hypothetical protein